MLCRAAAAVTLLLCTPASALVGGAIPADNAISRHVVLIVGPRGNSRMACTGTAIARDLVLTAAHCVQPGASVSVVEHDEGRRPKFIRVAGAERHPTFDFDTAISRGETADVALLKLAEPLSSQRLPAVLGERSIVLIGERFTVAGYGVTIDGEGRLGPLRSATLMAVRSPSVRHFQLADPATRGETAGLGACSGDSGGPVFEDTGGGRLVVMGVVSWATSPRGGAGCGGLTGATPLAPFREWIAETARKLGSPLQ
jgi:secreted trypsin-like serine protease